MPTQPVPPAPPVPHRATGAAPPPAEPQPEKWAGRVGVPGAAAPGQKKPAAPTTPTQYMAPYAEPGGTTAGAPGRAAPPTRADGSARATSRFFLALFALVLLLAVPVVSAYVAYKLASGGNPFEWPPTVDYDQIFGPRETEGGPSRSAREYHSRLSRASARRRAVHDREERGNVRVDRGSRRAARAGRRCGRSA